MQKIWNHYLQLLDRDLSTRIFDNLKNSMVCALLFAAGTEALHGEHPLFMSVFSADITGGCLIAFSALLMFINLCDGIRRFGMLRYHLAWQILIVLVYVLLSERLVEMMWNFRIG